MHAGFSEILNLFMTIRKLTLSDFNCWYVPEIALWFALLIACLEDVSLVHVTHECLVHVADLGTSQVLLGCRQVTRIQVRHPQLTAPNSYSILSSWITELQALIKSDCLFFI